MRGHFEERVATFEPEKALAAIGHLVTQTQADLYSVMKMLYLADKAHLARYGRTIAGDVYTAMKNGPVPERSYDLCKFASGKRSHFDPMPNARDYLRVEGYALRLLAEPDLRDLSKSDLDALNDAIAVYNSGGWRAVWRASHDSAWDAAWAEATARGRGSIDMDINAIAATLPNAAALIEYLADPHPGDADSPCAAASH